MKPFDLAKKLTYQFRLPPPGEQQLVREFFNYRIKGFYVDLGANDPIVESQSFHLEQLGWSGLLIEPIPKYASLLKDHRSGTVVEFACSSRNNHRKILTMALADGHSTLNAKPIALASESLGTIDIECRTLDSVLEENRVPSGFEFLSIDIEGHEMEMFDGFNIGRWKPQLVLLEDHVVNHQKHRFMKQNGYQLILRTGLNSWYVPKTHQWRLSLFSKLEFFRKYWIGLMWRKLRYAK
jgi:FkbM family methyltransferase